MSRVDELDCYLGHWRAAVLTSEICQYGLDCLGGSGDEDFEEGGRPLSRAQAPPERIRVHER